MIPQVNPRFERSGPIPKERFINVSPDESISDGTRRDALILVSDAWSQALVLATC